MLFAVIAAVLAVEVLLLAKENRRLRAAFEPHSEPPEAERFAVGDFVGDFDVLGADGLVRTVEFDGEYDQTLLLVFTEDCTGCSMVMPDWRAVLDRLPARTRVVALQLDRTEASRADLLPVPVATPLHGGDGEGLPLAKLTMVPITAVLDLAGIVAWAHHGSMDELTLESLEQALAAGAG